MKRAAVIQDISGFGKCSLTMSLPVLSACGVEACPMPTAVLSTHTSEFTNYTYRDLTEDMPSYIKHWASLGIEFSSIYSGYLGSLKQVQIVSDFVDQFRKENTFVLIDPCMGDGGELYSGIPDEMIQTMLGLCHKADLIVPNMTEAELMLGLPHRTGIVEPEYGEMLATFLMLKGIKRVAVTGIPYGNNKVGVWVCDSVAKTCRNIVTNRVDGFFYGTGDLFACSLLAGIENGKTILEAAEIASKITSLAVHKTSEAGIIPKNGLLFEGCIPDLMNSLL
ncbi:MAG: pyridoxamine kinase [Clostridia bacterium]|nr:pyridoxamine kinase [Clostridia bacterium]